MASFPAIVSAAGLQPDHILLGRAPRPAFYYQVSILTPEVSQLYHYAKG